MCNQGGKGGSISSRDVCLTKIKPIACFNASTQEQDSKVTSTWFEKKECYIPPRLEISPQFSQLETYPSQIYSVHNPFAHGPVAAVVSFGFEPHLILQVKAKECLGVAEYCLDHLLWNVVVLQVEEAVIFARLGVGCNHEQARTDGKVCGARKHVFKVSSSSVFDAGTSDTKQHELLQNGYCVIS